LKSDIFNIRLTAEYYVACLLAATTGLLHLHRSWAPCQAKFLTSRHVHMHRF